MGRGHLRSKLGMANWANKTAWVYSQTVPYNRYRFYKVSQKTPTSKLRSVYVFFVFFMCLSVQRFNNSAPAIPGLVISYGFRIRSSSSFVSTHFSRQMSRTGRPHMMASLATFDATS